MKTDVEIAQEAKMQPIREIAAELGLTEDDLELYGKYKAKLTSEVWQKAKDRENGKLVLVTAINPTPAGEGKTTTSVGLADGKKSERGFAGAFPGTLLRPQGGCCRGRLCPGGAHGGHQPALHR